MMSRQAKLIANRRLFGLEDDADEVAEALDLENILEDIGDEDLTTDSRHTRFRTERRKWRWQRYWQRSSD